MKAPIVLCYHGVGAEWDCPLAVSADMMEQQVKMMLKLGTRRRRSAMLC